MLDKGVIHFLGRMEQNSTKFHHAAHNDEQLQTDESIISGIFRLTFPDHSGPQVAKTTESKTLDTGELLYLQKPVVVYSIGRIKEKV